MTKALLTTVVDHGDAYKALMLWCPGCSSDGHGLLMLPVSGDPTRRPVWDWNGDLEKATISPSILTKSAKPEETIAICHSFLENGIWRYLEDSTHVLSGKTAEMVDLPEWVTA